MKVLIIYDSVYGNTEQIARAIGGAITGEVKVLCADEANPDQIENIDLFIVGSPTQGGKPTQSIQDFLKKVPDSSFKGASIATFDTRVTNKIANVFGYAAGRLAKELKGRGANIIVPPEGFFVTGTKGPLKDGELERAAAWAKGVMETKNI